MATRRLVISIALLLTYACGLAHELIPHSHHNLTDSQSTANHIVAHQATGVLPLFCGDVHSKAVIHVKRCSDSLLDFVLCLLDENDHSDVCSERILHLPSFAHDTAQELTFKVVATAVVLLTWDVLSIASRPAYQFAEQTTAYFAPHLPPTALRGPPSVSC